MILANRRVQRFLFREYPTVAGFEPFNRSEITDTLHANTFTVDGKLNTEYLLFYEVF